MIGLFEIRLDLELGAAKQVCQLGELYPVDEAAMLHNQAVAAVSRISELSTDEIVELDEFFYAALARMAGNQERLRTLSITAARGQFFRFMYLGESDQAEKSINRHVAICDALDQKNHAALDALFESNLFAADKVRGYINAALATIFAD